MKPNEEDGRKASFLLSNAGGSAATHLKFLLKTPQKILRLTNLSSENATLTNPNDTILEANLKRFVQGEGSFVSINITMTAPSKNYHAFATFDQGSTTGTFSLQPRFPKELLILIVAVPVYGVLVYFYIYKYAYKRWRQRREAQQRDLREVFERYIKSIGKMPDAKMRSKAASSLRRDLEQFFYKGRLDKATYEMIDARLVVIIDDERGDSVEDMEDR